MGIDHNMFMRQQRQNVKLRKKLKSGTLQLINTTRCIEGAEHKCVGEIHNLSNHVHILNKYWGTKGHREPRTVQRDEMTRMNVA